MQQSSGGALAFLDGLVQRAVDASAAVAQVKANLKGASTSDQTRIGDTASLQSAPASIPTLWLVAGGLVVVVIAALALRK